PRAAVAASPTAPGVARGRGGRVLFEVPFNSEMSDLDYARLARVLDLSTHTYQKQTPNPTSPGVARLDHFSGLFLERGADDGKWVLQARTCGNPAARTVHEWHLLAAQGARQLDPSVTLPERSPDTPRETPDRPLGQAANKRLASIRRHIVGLP
ncbi:MAG: hypothetical protein ACRDPA_28280, partial [Solirubrobacteraceae bacterium]